MGEASRLLGWIPIEAMSSGSGDLGKETLAGSRQVSRGALI
jgi:hypothetical protein